MGSEQSGTTPQERHYDTFMYAPVSSHRTEADYTSRFYAANNPRSMVKEKPPAPLLKTAYHGVWSLVYPSTIAPASRIGQCHVFDKAGDTVYIAYGIDANGHYLNDMWALYLKDMSWRRVSRGLLTPRAYPSAVLVGRFMYVFGGAMDNEFFADLHAVNIDTGEVKMIDCSGEGPCPRTSPMFFCFGERLYIWGGYDGTAQSGVYSIDCRGGEWHLWRETHSGLATPATCVHGDDHFVFGGVDGTSMARFTPTEGFVAMQCIGTDPAVDLSRTSLVSADEYVFLIGGEASFPYMHVFALDVKRSWWFAFHVRPDGDSLSLKDGVVNKIGLFMLPREHSATVVYSTQERELVSVMGSRMHEPPPVFKISIGEALAVVHLRSDMLEVLVSQRQ